MMAVHLPLSLILDGGETSIDTPWGLAKVTKPWHRGGTLDASENVGMSIRSLQQRTFLQDQP